MAALLLFTVRHMICTQVSFSQHVKHYQERLYHRLACYLEFKHITIFLHTAIEIIFWLATGASGKKNNSFFSWQAHTWLFKKTWFLRICSPFLTVWPFPKFRTSLKIFSCVNCLWLQVQPCIKDTCQKSMPFLAVLKATDFSSNWWILLVCKVPVIWMPSTCNIKWVTVASILCY